MENIRLTPLTHRGNACIGVYFALNITLNNIFKNLPFARWSKTHRCWYIPFGEQELKKLEEAVSGIAVTDAGALPLLPVELATATAFVSGVQSIQPASPVWRLDENNLAALRQYMQQLELKAYSASTIRTYRNEFMQLLKLLNKRPVYELTP